MSYLSPEVKNANSRMGDRKIDREIQILVASQGIECSSNESIHLKDLPDPDDHARKFDSL